MRARQHQKLFFLLGILLAGAALISFRFEQILATEQAAQLPRSVGETAEVTGVVTNDPERRETSLHVYIAVKTVGDEQVQGTLLAILPRDEKISYGDTVVVHGNISTPEAFETDSGRIFDYPNYLRVRGVSVIMRYATVEQVEEGGWSLYAFLFSLKHSFETSLERILPEPNVSLMEGILLGARRGIPEDLTHAFVISGLIHVVVLSGYNISIVADAMLRALVFLPRTLRFVTGGTMMILFALMTGAGATTVRASIMGLIAILARYLNRPTSALRALGLAAFLMVVWNPLSLVYDPSFILSVLATFGLITLSPWVEGWLPKFFDRAPSIKSIAASTIAVQIYILPALLYFTGVLSFVSLPANILALPAVPFTMLFGFMSGLLGLLHPLLGILPGAVANVLLEWMLFVAYSTAAFPFSATIVAEFPAWVAVVVYVPLTLFAIKKFRASQTSLPSPSN